MDPTAVAPVKIMYLMDDFSDPRGGSERQVMQLIRFLDRSRYEPAMTLLRRSGYIEEHGFPCQVGALGLTKLASMNSVPKMLRFGLALRREGYRLVHCFFNDVSIIAPPVLRMLGIRVIVSRRDLGFWYTPAILLLLRLVRPFVDRYVANSKGVQRVVQEREWVPSRKISVIYNGHLPAESHRETVLQPAALEQVPDSVPIVGIVANLKPIKRIEDLLQAFAFVLTKCPTARLLVIGEDGPAPGSGTMLERLTALARQLGIEGRVTFMGSVGNPADSVRKFAVGVLCSESEGFSNSLVEYMQAGCAVVCTDTGGNPEVVQDGSNGFLVPVGDVDALGDRIARLLCDAGLAKRLGDAGRISVEAYSHTRMVAAHMSCYDEVLSICRALTHVADANLDAG